MSSHMQYTEQNMYSCLPLVTWGASSLVEDDVKCLGRVKSSLNDPGRKLSSWSFPKTSVAFLCNLQALDLSNNELSGRIPAQIYSWLPYLVTVDLSNNDIPGEVPPSFSGVSRARLSIEYIFMGAFRIQAWVEVPFVSVFGRDDNCYWLEWLRAHQPFEHSLFKTPLVNVKLADLMKSTNNFNAENVIALTREGTTYKAVLLDESMLATKLLNTCKFGEQFQPLFLHQNISSTSIQLPFLHQNIGSKVILVDKDFDACIMKISDWPGS
ncbi:hypothetical protein JRO89_XS12G0097200 [Xanthoceras sorbifolium]|uniref:Leucine-rich repeat-containing N-terminal plant-type domain-containing protein n=1 Tax=Xanthoceras sorbifolium TaxID=99658 RepID=A0ABQ8HC02_9ROSI|nr:hypothetical protein JRO89_XS12G0097200 [Xanthoceras sorbifolium]